MREPKELHPGLARLIREEIRAGFFCEPPTAQRDQPHDLDLQRRVLSSVNEGIEIVGLVPPLTEDDFYGDFHRTIWKYLHNSAGVLDRHIKAEWETIEDTPVSVGAPLREHAAQLRELAHRRTCANHLRRALARIETGDDLDLIEGAIRCALDAL